MSATTMHFGPEWMRTKHQPLSRAQPPPSPPPTNTISGTAVSTYSALVSATPPAPSEASDEVHPFRYSKEELIRIYQEGGGKGGLGLEVEKWEGVVREAGAEPIALREMSETEKKLFAGPLNSELRRRPSQSTDFLSPLNTSSLDRPRLAHSASSSANSPLRERFGALKRRDSGAAGSSDPAMLNLPRKPSLSTLQAPTLSPRDVSPRTRVGLSSFDGVLNSGESWIARRRTAEAPTKTGNGLGRETTDNQQSKASAILEEEKEDKQRAGLDLQRGESQSFFPSSPQLRTEEPHLFDAMNAPTDNLGNGIPTTPFPTNGTTNSNHYGNNHMGVGPPPGLIDLAAVEWSYKDPTGQIQGPFRADLMQKWYNAGYFSSDLPMKRAVYDTHWTTVEELIQKANGENIFLSSLVTSIPISHRNDSPLQTYPPPDGGFNEPLQPAPIRTLRTSTLESYLNGSSIASDSPSSSVGASHFANPSPDPGAFGGRDIKPYYGGDVGGRLTNFGIQDHLSPYPDRHPLGHEYPNNAMNLPQQGPSFGNFIPDRDPIYNGYGYNQQPIAHDPWMIPSNNIPSMFAGGRELTGRSEHVHNEPMPRAFNQPALYPNGNLTGFNEHVPGANDIHQSYSQYEFGAQPGFQNIQDSTQLASPARALRENSPQSNPLIGYRDLNLDSVVSKSPPANTSNLPTVPIQSPWNGLSKSSTPEHISKSDNVQPVFASTIPHSVAPASQSPWNQEAIFGVPAEHKPPVLVDGSLENKANTVWNGNPTANNFATGNLVQNNEQQETADIAVKRGVSPMEHTVHSSDASDSAPFPEIPAVQSNQPSKAPQKPTAAPQTSPTEAPAPHAIPKTAWAKEEEGKKKKAAAPSISLREIQEAEAKKLENRKAAEREKEKLARISSIAETKEDTQPFTTSWGLPTSQAGSRAGAAPREVPIVPAQSPATTPVWTTPLKQATAKKSMKEIQEEEEGRKKLAALKEASIPVASKRGYAETTTKIVAPSPASTSSNAWTTVGPSGKTSTPVLPSPVRSLVQNSTPVPVPSASTLSRASSSPVQRNVASSALKTRPVVTKQDDPSDTPSHDFLKWLSDSLKGLNSSVNVEEIVSMLLSFPLDPDASTIEIISDTIYSNSTTLDGRRFASEFVAKRKIDARSKSSTSSKAKPISIADVVKATPKAAQPEWGFKVVNKKKKGGRS